MKLESHPQELTQVPFSKTECGVDFNINTDTHERLLVRIKEELNHPLADSYHIIVSLLHYLLMTLNVGILLNTICLLMPPRTTMPLSSNNS